MKPEINLIFIIDAIRKELIEKNMCPELKEYNDEKQYSLVKISFLTLIASVIPDVAKQLKDIDLWKKEDKK